MRKVFVLEDLDCANCAAKMEAAIQKIPGVKKASVNFMAQKLTLEAEESEFEAILMEAVRCVERVDSDCKVIL